MFKTTFFGDAISLFHDLLTLLTPSASSHCLQLSTAARASNNAHYFSISQAVEWAIEQTCLHHLPNSRKGKNSHLNFKHYYTVTMS